MTALYATPVIKDFLNEPLKEREATIQALASLTLDIDEPNVTVHINKAHNVLQALSNWAEGK